MAEKKTKKTKKTKKPKSELETDPDNLQETLARAELEKSVLNAEIEEWKDIANGNTEKLNLLHDALFTQQQALLIQKILVSSDVIDEPTKLILIEKILGLTPLEQDYTEVPDDFVEGVETADYN